MKWLEDKVLKDLIITLQPESPLCLPKESRSSFPESKEHIPGSTLRGALASHYLREIGKNDLFEQIFLEDENVFFTNLYPTNNSEIISSPFPLSAVSCKRYPEDHEKKDTLFLYSAQELNYKMTGEVKDLNDIYICKTCNNDLKGISGYYYFDSKNKLEQSKVQKNLTLHNGINRETNTVEESIFYGLETISSDLSNPNNTLVFKGVIKVKDELEELFIKSFNNFSFFMGRAKTRGNGLVKIKVENYNNNDIKFKEKLETWSNKFQSYCKNIFKLEAKDFYFSIKFENEAILLDEFLRYTSDISELSSCNLIYKSIKSKEIKGWNSLQKLPKTTEIGVSEGSSYLFSVDISKKDEIIKLLEQMETKGLGIRKNEGFGKIVVSDLFHSERAVGMR